MNMYFDKDYLNFCEDYLIGMKIEKSQNSELLIVSFDVIGKCPKTNNL